MSTPPLTRRQREIVDFFKTYTEQNAISPTLEEIAHHFGLNKVTIFGHVGELQRKGVLQSSAKGVSRGYQLVSEIRSAPGASIQILGSIAAGVPIEAIEQPEQMAFEELVPPGKDVYALRVRGDSMIEDAICDGDMVLIERRSNPRQGETVVGILPGEEATLKRFYREPDGRIRLQPANSTMQPIVVDEVEVRGVVIGIIRQY